MLNSVKDYKRYIDILNCILDLPLNKCMKLTLKQQFMLSVLYNEYYTCWCSGDFRSQDISSHDIDLPNQNSLFPGSEELICLELK